MMEYTSRRINFGYSMFYLLITAILGLGGFGGAFVEKSSTSDSTRGAARMAWVLCLLLMPLWTGVNAVRFVKTGEVGVPTVFGKIDTSPKAVKTAGIAFKYPWESLRTINVQVQSYVRNSDRADQNEGSGTIYIQQQALTTDAAYQFRLNPDYAGLILTKFGENWEVQVANAVSQSLRVGGIVLNEDGTPQLVDGDGNLTTDQKNGRVIELTLEQAQGSKRTVLQRNIEIAFRTTLRNQLAAAGFEGDQLNAIIPGVVTIGETAPPSQVLEAIAMVEARKKEVEASVLLVQIAENRTQALATQGLGVRAFVAQSQGIPVEQFKDKINPTDAARILDSLNTVEQTTNVRAAIEKGTIDMMVLPSNSTVATPAPATGSR